MHLCSVCPEPGHCCRRFDLSRGGQQIVYWKDTWEQDYQADFAENKYPFVATGIREEYSVQDQSDPDFGKQYVSLWYSCPKVTSEGRCSIYKNRPMLCRTFLPGSSALCVFHAENHVRASRMRQ